MDTRKQPWVLIVLAVLSGCADDEKGDVDAPRDASMQDAGGPRDASMADAGGAQDASMVDAGLVCAEPEAGLLAVFDVVGERFRINLTDAEAIEDAFALFRDESRASIPNGRLVCERSRVNCGYTWHVVPGSVTFAELTTEVCDGAPSYVERTCERFVDTYCPWSAELVKLADCRSGTCVPVTQASP